MGDIALGIFQETLENLVISSKFKLRRDRRRLRSLKEKIKYMRDFLKDTEKKRYEHSKVMNLVRQIKDVVFEAENIVERYIVVTATLNYVDYHPSLLLGNVMKKIKTLTAEIKQIYDENVYDINGVVGKELEHSVSKFEEGNTLRVAEEKVVGLGKEVETLMGKLLESGEGGQLEIISIVGAAGGGKTTLANEVYHHPLMSHTFQIRAWINVSQDYNKTLKRNLLVRILESASLQECEDREKSSEDELGEKAHNCLKGKKYLIVMDDIWGVEAWNDIQRSLPKECSSSKVLFTSRLHVQPDSIHYVPHYVVPLSKSCSWNLLQKKVFGKKCCPEELVDIGEQIAEKCKGLPLAIVAIAGILAVQDKKLNVWEKVSKNLSSIITKNQDRCMEILELSYNHMPLHLKACFVYIGGFPEDSEILVKDLIWLWIAEGFIQQTEGGKSLEEIAKGYLSSLIERNLVMEARKRSLEGIKACSIHDLLRELCLKKAKDNFLVQNYGVHMFSPSATTKHRRLFIGTQSFLEFSTGPCTVENLRSFLCLHLQDSKDLSFEPDLSFFIDNFELLRVLCFESPLNCQDKGRGYLVHLRYLALRISKQAPQIQVPFSNLFNLETLYIKHLSWNLDDTVKDILLPRNIFDIVKLRHLCAKDGVFNYHHGKPDHSSKLYNLQTLHKVCSCELCRNFLVRTPNLIKLGLCEQMNDYFDLKSIDLEFLKCLENLHIVWSFWGSTLPQVLKFPPTIMRLTLELTWLKWEELSILLTAFPSLEVLKLLCDACRGPIWDISELEGFSKLKYLRLEQVYIKEWIASEDQFPMLEVLVVKQCQILKQIPINFANLNELRQIEVSWSTRSAEKSAREIQEERRKERGDDGCIDLLLFNNNCEYSVNYSGDRFRSSRRFRGRFTFTRRVYDSEDDSGPDWMPIILPPKLIPPS